ncbi:hypothetical protein GCM10010510_69550 [Streptomyces anandii JCM 4720]|nr:hypothetical protein GCM10010510_69550 [Streptomyces anandii JCM 4720]
MWFVRVHSGDQYGAGAAVLHAAGEGERAGQHHAVPQQKGQSAAIRSIGSNVPSRIECLGGGGAARGPQVRSQRGEDRTRSARLNR